MSERCYYVEGPQPVPGDDARGKLRRFRRDGSSATLSTARPVQLLGHRFDRVG